MLYLGDECADSVTKCGVVEQVTLRTACNEVASVCVHLLAGPEPWTPGRTALCEAHSLLARGLDRDLNRIERMHSI